MLGICYRTIPKYSKIFLCQERRLIAKAKKGCQADSRKKVVVSGPGTGKSFLFQEILKNCTGDCLALTFINNLVNKLQDDLGSHASCSTLHSFCKRLLHIHPALGLTAKFNFYPKLHKIIKADTEITLDSSVDVGPLLRNLDESSPELQFYIQRANYYNAVRFDDSVYRVLTAFRSDSELIPQFEQILVDEYQDFNKLEVEFINKLGEKSNILIVGDDDQALYSVLRSASAKFIRDKFINSDWAAFQLPYCSRCPQVIVDALDDVVKVAQAKGKLQGRVDKKYICYLPDKTEDSKLYPRIIHAKVTVHSKRTPYLAKYIERIINDVPIDQIQSTNKKADYTVLVAGPYHYLTQINEYLQENTDWDIRFSKKAKGLEDPTMLEGYKFLLNNSNDSNLGWRILLACEPIKETDQIIKNIQVEEKPIIEYLPENFVDRHKTVLEILRKIQSVEGTSDDEKLIVVDIVGFDIDEIKNYLLEEEEDVEDELKVINDNGPDNEGVLIILTSHIGTKGLSAGYVFVLGMNEGFLPHNNNSPEDIDICTLLVLLTRTIKQCHLLSLMRFGGVLQGYPSAFFRWINNSRIEEVNVNRNYWCKS